MRIWFWHFVSYELEIVTRWRQKNTVIGYSVEHDTRLIYYYKMSSNIDVNELTAHLKPKITVRDINMRPNLCIAAIEKISVTLNQYYKE